MNPAYKNHAAVVFGRELTRIRRARSYTARAVADQIDLEPSKYTEVELGIVKWLTDEIAALLAFALNLTQEEIAKFKKLLTSARKADALGFSDLFSRDSLRPARLRFDGRKATKEEEEEVLDSVFAELV